MKASNATNVNEYISAFDPDVQEKLQLVRVTINKAAPEAVEIINYNIPTLVLHKNLVHYAAFKNHIGFYPGPSGIEAFKEELSEYKTAKGSVQFPFNKSIPLDLVSRIVEYRLEENLRRRDQKNPG